MKRNTPSKWTLIFWMIFFLFIPGKLFSMHIMEGFLPVAWSAGWSFAIIPFIVFGAFSLKNKIRENPKAKIFLSLAGVYTFVLSALKIPSVTGSCSHPTGMGLGTILFGVGPMVILGLIVLIFQALLLAHGGITTLGANTFAMAVAKPFATWGIFTLLRRTRLPFGITVFLAAVTGGIMTYLVTALQLSLAFAKFTGVFALTQVPLAVSEGLLTVVVMNLLRKYSGERLKELLPEGRNV